jgi:hypothetical protein
VKKHQLFLSLIIALALVVGYRWTHQEPSPVEVSRNAPISPVISGRNDHVETLQPVVNTLGAVTQASPRPSDVKNPYAKKPTEEVVDFKVVNGLAIAYGDTLLGRAPPDFTGLFGRSESPRVQTWDQPEIPYSINPSLPDPSRVQRAIDYFNQHTVVKFIPFEGQKDAIVFEPGDEECISYLGRTVGLQPIRLVRGCGTQEILHEMMHALGFIHEQSRPDRDQFVDVLWDNIEERFQSQFAMVPDSLVEPERDSPFDYRSVMMYRPTIFAARPGQPTMQSKSPNSISPVTEGLSDTDIARVNRLYGGAAN